MRRNRLGEQFEQGNVQEIIDSYSDFVVERLDEGWAGYLLTIQFRELGGSMRIKMGMMIHELHRMHRTMLTRLKRNPFALSSDELPTWIAIPDFPVPKYAKQPLRTVTVNEGLHWHAICLVPAKVRIKQCLASHIERFQGVYVRDRNIVFKLHAEMIHYDPPFMVDYAFKSLKKRWVSLDDIVIFPRARSELPCRLAPGNGPGRTGSWPLRR